VSDPTAADVLAALTAAGRVADRDAAQAVARVIAAYGDIDRAEAALANDEAHDLLAQLLAYRAAVAELADPVLRIARLEREADGLDARAEPSWTEAAEFAGKAGFRRLQGEGELAAVFQRRTEAAERLAAALEAQAFAKRLEAAGLRAALACRAGLGAVLRTIAA
jgi:hypothetical protein